MDEFIERRITLHGALEQVLIQQGPCVLQSLCELFVSRLNLSSKSLDGHAKGSRQFYRIELLHESSLEQISYLFWKLIHPATMDGRKPVANAR
ncbi:MAG: hypothetical protein M3Z09_12445 [Acidobacteriota bacterium]|nr:hypothetical protein [Acidobacteriota bacterium]